MGTPPDVEGPLSVKAMARDTIASWSGSSAGRPGWSGCSAGAIVALHVAVQRLDLVQRLVLKRGAFHPDGLLAKPVFDGPPPAPLLSAYAEVSPDGAEHFPVVLAKVTQAAQDLGASAHRTSTP